MEIYISIVLKSLRTFYIDKNSMWSPKCKFKCSYKLNEGKIRIDILLSFKKEEKNRL